MIKEKYIKSFDGTKLFYQIHRSKGPWIVMIHSPGSNHTTFNYEIKKLKDRKYSLLIPDLRNHGKSGVGSISMENLLKDLDFILKKENISNYKLYGGSASSSLLLEFYKNHNNVNEIFLLYPSHYNNFKLKGKLYYFLGHVLFLFLKKRKPEEKQFIDLSTIGRVNLIDYLKIIRRMMSFRAYLLTLKKMIKIPMYKDFKVPTNIVFAKNEDLSKYKLIKGNELVKHSYVNSSHTVEDLRSLETKKEAFSLLFDKQNQEKKGISIIIPTLNEEKYIGNLLNCLTNQTYKNFEVIVVDGNSSDNTIEIVRSFRSKMNITLIGSNRGNHSFDRNLGAKHAKNNLLLFLEADVHFKSNFLEKSVLEFNKKQADVAIPKYIPNSNKLYHIFFFWSLNSWFFLFQKFYGGGIGTGIFIKKSLHNIIGGFNSNLRVAEDVEYMSRAAKSNRFFTLNSKLYVCMRRFEVEGSKKIMWKWLKMYFLVMIDKKYQANKIPYEFGGF